MTITNNGFMKIKKLFGTTKYLDHIKMNKHNNYLTCKRVIFYSHKDEDTFFEWIKKIPSITHFEGARDELYLDMVSNIISDEDLKDLIALFYRYKIDMKQLCMFLNVNNKQWFYENKKTFWHNKIFGSSHK
jgi:hypothetical protein